jgi:hypothetical protein
VHVTGLPQIAGLALRAGLRRRLRVVFFSAASDLVPTDGNALSDVFVRDVSAGTTTRVSVDTAGGDANGRSDSSEAGHRSPATGIASCSVRSRAIWWSAMPTATPQTSSYET